MILSGRDIQWAIERKRLIVRPVALHQFAQNGLDLVLHSVNSSDGILHKGEFYLGRTTEYFEFPDDIMAFVQLRSTYARKGILLPPTIVDAGFKGTLTLEIVSFQDQPVPVGERFAHLIFGEMSSQSVPYAGKYQHQIEITPAIPDKK
jgi:dCTP deaminase